MSGNNTVNYMYGYSGEDWSKYTDTLTTGSVTISPQEPLKITGEVYLDPMKDLKSVYSYDDMSSAEMAEEDAVYPIREDVPAELWNKPVSSFNIKAGSAIPKRAVRNLVRRETVEYYHEGSKVRRVTKTEQWFPDGEGEFAGPDKPLTSTYVEYIGGRK